MQKIEINKTVLDEIYEQAKKEYPSECCGWIIKNSDNSMTYFAAENLQDKYHKLDPDSYPRTSHDAFLMDSLKLTRAIEEAEANKGSLYSIVHSHIDCGAYFSDEDKKQMATPDGIEQVFPAFCYFVVSIDNGENGDNAGYIFNNDNKEFIEAEIVIS